MRSATSCRTIGSGWSSPPRIRPAAPTLDASRSRRWAPRGSSGRTSSLPSPVRGAPTRDRHRRRDIDPQVSVAIGTEQEIIGRIQVVGRARQESVTPALERLLAWTGVDLGQIGGVAVGIGPGLFTGLRVGVETAKTLAQVTRAMILGFTR